MAYAFQIGSSAAAAAVLSPSAPLELPRTEAGAQRARDADDDLLERIGHGDQAAYRLLVQRHIDRAFALALRILDNPTDAEDVVQDVLLKVWLHRGRWESGRARFSTWLYRVVTNRCIDLRRQPRTDDIETAPEIADAQPDAETMLHQKDVAALIETAMGRLPDHQRVALILSYHESMSNAEIAEVMQTTVSAVESLLKRGRQRLRQMLQDQERQIRQSFTND